MDSPYVNVFGWIDDEIRLRTRKIGLWLDTTALNSAQTVDTILRRLDETAAS